jgi:hypothetical protein
MCEVRPDEAPDGNDSEKHVEEAGEVLAGYASNSKRDKKRREAADYVGNGGLVHILNDTAPPEAKNRACGLPYRANWALSAARVRGPQLSGTGDIPFARWYAPTAAAVLGP